MHWLNWSWVPGIHWLAWLQAGILVREPMYYAFAFIYAVPTLMLILSRRLSLRLLLLSWGISLIHILFQKRVINRRLAQLQAARGVPEKLMQALLRTALNHGGCLTVTQGVMETGAPFAEVEQALQAMVAAGYVYTRDNIDTGVIEYVFTEMG